MKDALGNEVNVGDLVIYKRHHGSYNYAVVVVKEIDAGKNLFYCFEPVVKNVWNNGDIDNKLSLRESRLKQTHWKIIARLERHQIQWILNDYPDEEHSQQQIEKNQRLIFMLFEKQREILRDGTNKE